MKKRINMIFVAGLFLLVLMMLMGAASAESGTCGEHVTWTLDSAGTLTISGTGNMTDYGYNNAAPWGKNIRTVIINEGVTSVGDYAFYSCGSLSTVTLPEGIVKIGRDAFFLCSSLGNIVIPHSVETIEYGAFDATNIRSLNIPENVTSIVLNNGDDTPLYEIIVSPDNPNYCSADGVLYTKDMRTLLRYPRAKEGDFTVPDTVVTIAEKAFYACRGLTRLVISDSVKTIKSSCFSSCYNLTEIVIPTELENLTCYFTFSYCSSLSSIILPDCVTEIGNHTFWNCTNLLCVTIPDSVTNIDSSAFENCPSGLILNVTEGSYAETYAQSHNMEYSAQRIYDYTISDGAATITGYSGNKKNVHIPELLGGCPVVAIGGSAFSGDESIRNIVIPETVTEIGDNAFNGCVNLESIKIPRPVQSIGNGAFSGCSNLTIIGKKDSYAQAYAVDKAIPFTPYTVIVKSGTCGTDCEYELDDDGMMRIWGTGETTGTKDTSFYSGQIIKVVIEEGIIGISDGAFANYSESVQEVIIPNSVLSIGTGAFIGCKNLTEIWIPDAVNSIGTSVFYYKYPVTIYASFESNGAKALSKAGCSFRIYGTQYDLQYIFAESEVTGIELVSCDKDLISFAIPDYVTNIRNYAFANCDSLNSITIPGNDGILDERIRFDYCSVLNNLTILEGVTNIGNSMFSNCASLTSITIPNSLTCIGSTVFSGCSSLTSITIPDGLTNIATGAFSNCPAILYASLDSDGARALSEKNYTFRVPGTHCDVKYTTYHTSSGLVEYVELRDYDRDRTSLVIPDFITNIEDNLYSEMENLNEIHCVSCTSYAYRALYSRSALKGKLVLDNPHIMVMVGEIPATCSQAGQTEGERCSLCGRVNYGCETIPKLAHTIVVDAEVPATYTEPGLTEGSHCAICGEIIVAQQRISPIWDIETNGNTVSLIKYNSSESNLTVPQTIDGKTVTEIKDNAFAESNCPSRVYIPKTVTLIGDAAFARNTTIYCYRYSEADFWADDVGYPKVYVDNSTSGDFYIIQMQTGFRLECGNSRQLDASVWPITGNEQLVWSSSNPDAVSVENGIVSAQKPGSTRVTLQVGGVTAGIDIVAYAYPSSFNISLTDTYVVSGEPITLEIVDVLPEGAEIEITWTTSNSRVVEVDQSGTITPRRIGSATIYATSQNEIVRECAVIVCYPVTAISFETNQYSVETQKTVQVIANAQTDNEVYQNRLVVFSSSDETVATVDQNGIVTGYHMGSAVITATAVNDATIQAAATVTVNCPGHYSEIYAPAITPGCETDGCTAGLYCPKCGLIIQEPERITAYGHVFTLVDEAPADVGRAGYQLYECSHCGERNYETLAALPEGYRVIGKTWKVYMAYRPAGTGDPFDQSQWPSGYSDISLVFSDNGRCTYKIVNTRGNLVSGTSDWSLDNKTLRIPSMNTNIGSSSSSETGIVHMSGTIQMMLYTNSKTYVVYLSPDGVRPTTDYSPYIGTWTADHIIRPTTGLRVSSEYWPSINSTIIIINEDNTLSINGNEGNWECSGTDGTFYVDEEPNIIQFNDLGQMVFWLGDGDYLILTRNGTGKLLSRKMVLPSRLMTVEEEAFERTNAQEVIINSNCTTIGSKAFANSKALRFVMIASSVRSIADDAFESCSVTICSDEGSYAWQWALSHGVDVIKTE